MPASQPVEPLEPLDPTPYLIPNLLPRRSINLVIGASGAGKTSLLLQQIASYVQGQPFLEYSIPPCKPEQVGVIVANQTFDALYYLVRKQGIEPLYSNKIFPIEEFFQKEATDLDILEDLYLSLGKQAGQPIRLLLIDGLQDLMTSGKVNDPAHTRKFYADLRKFTAKYDCTILGTVGTAKMKGGEYYKRLGDWALGSAVWANQASTLIGVEQLDLAMPPETRGTYRRIQVQPRSELLRVLYGQFDQQKRLILCPRPQASPEAAGSPAFSALDSKLDTYPPGKEFDRETFIEWGGLFEVSDRTVDRWIASRVADIGTLEKSGTSSRNTVYRKSLLN